MTDLPTLLRDTDADLTLDVPVEQVVRRGTRLRRRRKVTVAAGLATAVGAAALLVLPLIDRPTSEAGGFATSGPAMIALSADDLRQAEHWCRQGLGESSGGRLGTVFAGARAGGDVVLLFHGTGPDGASIVSCAADGGGMGAGVDALVSAAPGPGRELVTDLTTMTDLHDDGDPAVIVAGRVANDVSTVVATIGGRTVQAAVDQGWFWLWAPATHAGPPDDVTAYDDQGQVLDVAGVDSIAWSS